MTVESLILSNLDPFCNTDSILEEDCNDCDEVIDSSAILRAVSYMPSDHETGSGNDDDDDDEEEKEEWIDEQNERNVFTFSFDVEDFWQWKSLCNCLFYSNYEKILWRFRVTMQKLFLIFDNATFEKKKFLIIKAMIRENKSLQKIWEWLIREN